MVWARVDDHLHAHPKIRRAWQADPASLGLHLLALSYANDYLTDGEIDEAFVRELLPFAKARRRAVGALVDAGLWESNGAAWRIHDYLKYNRSRAAELTRRAKDSARKQQGRVQMDSARNPRGKAK